jgi:phosphonate metabolism protein PhnN/1,5-bisphosphokinase (PRPP-forming)
MNGCWVFVCGASGAGKDSVMRWAEVYLAERQDIVFARRLVTRPITTDSDHVQVSVEQFEHQSACGELAWQWQAHGFNYGIDARYCALVAMGKIVVVNGSREHAQQLGASEQIRVVQIELSDADLEARLVNRGRESRQNIAERLARNQLFGKLGVHHRIVNDGELATAGQAFANYLVTDCRTPSSMAK